MYATIMVAKPLFPSVLLAWRGKLADGSGGALGSSAAALYLWHFLSPVAGAVADCRGAQKKSYSAPFYTPFSVWWARFWRGDHRKIGGWFWAVMSSGSVGCGRKQSVLRFCICDGCYDEGSGWIRSAAWEGYAMADAYRWKHHSVPCRHRAGDAGTEHPGSVTPPRSAYRL
ncbi:MAG: hypothetical protein ACLR23_08640 [Clostridia bacterium]